MQPTVTKIGDDLYQVTIYASAVDSNGNIVYVVSQQLQSNLEDYQQQLVGAQATLAASQAAVDSLQSVISQIQTLG